MTGAKTGGGVIAICAIGRMAGIGTTGQSREVLRPCVRHKRPVSISTLFFWFGFSLAEGLRRRFTRRPPARI
jgi:hypothetical protein